MNDDLLARGRKLLLSAGSRLHLHEVAVMWAAAAALAALYVRRHERHPLRPAMPSPTDGWWSWTDQNRYLAAAQAWADGVLDPAQHWYLPGYSLMAAPFAHLMPAQPFLVPDLLCLLAAFWAFASLAARLEPGLPGARLLGASAFLATTALAPKALESWIIPWTTTPTAALTFTCLALALRFGDVPNPRTAFLLALSGMSVALFRPTDVLIVLLGVAPFLVVALLRRWPGPRRAGGIALAALAGCAVPAAILVGAHVAVHGFASGPYLQQSASVGFEWTLLPLRWVLIALGPHLLFREGPGLAVAFPWFLPGIAGMAACLAASGPDGRMRHLLVVGVTALHVAFYLSYRDLHPQGLWRFNNYHYFKPVLPMLGLYAALLALSLFRATRWRAVTTGVLVLAALVPWRAEWAPGVAGGAALTGPHTLTLARGLGSASGAVLLAGRGSWGAVYFGHHTLQVTGRTWFANSDLKAFPVPGGLLVVPLRTFPAEETRIMFDAALALDGTIEPALGQQGVVFGVPCLFPRHQAGCSAVTALPDLAPGR